MARGFGSHYRKLLRFLRALSSGTQTLRIVTIRLGLAPEDARLVAWGFGSKLLRLLRTLSFGIQTLRDRTIRVGLPSSGTYSACRSGLDRRFSRTLSFAIQTLRIVTRRFGLAPADFRP